MKNGLFSVLLLFVAAAALDAQESPLEWAAKLEHEYMIVPNVTYHIATGYEAKIDLYVARNRDIPRPTILWIHGGGWFRGNKEEYATGVPAFLSMGLNVVNVEYRLAHIATAPAATEDCLCALRWVVRHAEEYGIDVDRIVVGGQSAGGGLALTTGMIPASEGMDRQCSGFGDYKDVKVAAIINWFGISEVGNVTEGSGRMDFGRVWIGGATDDVKAQIAKRVSATTYVRPGVPPVLSVHGTNDQAVPYEQSLRLHELLTDAGVPNELMSIDGGGHGTANIARSVVERTEIYTKMRDFLVKHGVLDSPGAPSSGAGDQQ